MQGDHFKPDDLKHESDPECDEKIDTASSYHKGGTNFLLNIGERSGDGRQDRRGLVDLLGRALRIALTYRVRFSHDREVSVAKNQREIHCSSKLREEVRSSAPVVI